VQARSLEGMWYDAVVVGRRGEDNEEVKVHFNGWNKRYDEWITLGAGRLRSLGDADSPSPSQRQGTPPNGDAGAGEQEEEGAAETAAAAAVAAEKWVGNQLRARDRVGSWYDSKVVDWRGETGAIELKIHFNKWNSRHDEWISLGEARLLNLDGSELTGPLSPEQQRRQLQAARGGDGPQQQQQPQRPPTPPRPADMPPPQRPAPPRQQRQPQPELEFARPPVPPPPRRPTHAGASAADHSPSWRRGPSLASGAEFAIPKRKRAVAPPFSAGVCATPGAGANVHMLQVGDPVWYRSGTAGASHVTRACSCSCSSDPLLLSAHLRPPYLPGRVAAEVLSVSDAGVSIRVDDWSEGTRGVHTTWSRLEPRVPEQPELPPVPPRALPLAAAASPPGAPPLPLHRGARLQARAEE